MIPLHLPTLITSVTAYIISYNLADYLFTVITPLITDTFWYHIANDTTSGQNPIGFFPVNTYLRAKIQLEKAENIYEAGQVILINKPYDWTSFDVVRKVRNLLRVRKIGHAGTLDPLASGLLILCTGKFTKKINEYMASEKEYIGSFTLGATTPTYDLESEPENFQPFEQLGAEQIHGAAKPFTGEILQIPPMHSAIKKDGKRVYKLARQGKEIELEPRRIVVSEFEITEIELPVVHFRIVCSTGTYIRSIANDFGKLLGCGAYLSGLVRTRIGEFHLRDAVSIEQLADIASKERQQQKDIEQTDHSDDLHE